MLRRLLAALIDLNMKPQYGVTYYRITYADSELSMPSVEPMVYIGTNIFDDEKEDTLYFQDTVSVVRFGLLDEAPDTDEILVMNCLSQEFGSSMVHIDQLHKIISEASRTHRELGYPKLRKSEGNWRAVDESY